MGNVKLRTSELPKCETCDRYKPLRDFRGTCDFIMDQAFVTIENVDSVWAVEDALDVIVERAKLAPLSSFGCRLHTDFIQLSETDE